MRPDILEHGYRPTAKALFTMVRLFSGQPLPDVVRLMMYRPDFFGAHARAFTHQVMRGPSAWSVADRELMAACISQANDTAFCLAAHTATAARAYRDAPKVQAVLADIESAPVEDGLRAVLVLLTKLTRDGTVDAEDMRKVLPTGVTRDQITDALAVSAVFNVINRLADTFDFELQTPKGLETGAKFLLARGYR
ncbi:alkylhydroperoxidase AhpD family core domain-containing protein [Nocardia sp. ET3-3]|uniref:Alkylhydroperoxidase AhpD family core domain-containing protein n=1 Tax=Nocardia terrae TaxID=2675851 RepID=A0A7K1VB42_9NOCA|nr:carboxymuconolactone decarboxylase family protein [Nocardia terrae]MVU83298.1 alkylhydroperoxidase AhpD family core domain-containing protein [Nocardia terrae]